MESTLFFLHDIDAGFVARHLKHRCGCAIRCTEKHISHLHPIFRNRSNSTSCHLPSTEVHRLLPHQVFSSHHAGRCRGVRSLAAAWRPRGGRAQVLKNHYVGIRKAMKSEKAMKSVKWVMSCGSYRNHTIDVMSCSHVFMGVYCVSILPSTATI